jgi:hypothetical protein
LKVGDRPSRESRPKRKVGNPSVTESPASANAVKLLRLEWQ